MHRTPTAGGWLLNGEYTFMDGAPKIDEVDQIVGGRVRHVHGGVRHAIGLSGAWKTHLAWEFDTLTAAREALLAISSVPVLAEAHVAPTDETRIQDPDAYQTRRSEVLAGKARCMNCRERIQANMDNEMALQGVPVGDEAVLECAQCGLRMAWLIAPEDDSEERL